MDDATDTIMIRRSESEAVTKPRESRSEAVQYWLNKERTKRNDRFMSAF